MGSISVLIDILQDIILRKNPKGGGQKMGSSIILPSISENFQLQTANNWKRYNNSLKQILDLMVTHYDQKFDLMHFLDSIRPTQN